MIMNVGQAKTNLSKLLARIENGEEVDIARDGVPVARLVPIKEAPSPGKQFQAASGTLAGRIVIEDDFELTESELDTILDEPS